MTEAPVSVYLVERTLWMFIGMSFRCYDAAGVLPSSVSVLQDDGVVILNYMSEWRLALLDTPVNVTPH